jgi:hypothetical protein
MKNALSIVCLVLVASCLSVGQQQTQLFSGAAPASSGKYNASAYAGWAVHSVNAVAAGAGTMTLDNCYPKMGQPDNIRQIFPFAVNVPVTIIDGSLTESALAVTAVTTPTANTASSTNPYSCSFTATFANAHAGGVSIISGDNGLAEAINDAHSTGGVVRIDPGSGITNAQLNSTTAVYHNVVLEDDRSGAVQYWNPQGGLTTLAAPATLTATTVGFGLNGAATTGGAYTGTSTYVVCIAYVDAMGQEGPCSATFSALTAGTGAVNQIGFSAPAASTGAVGYVPYISLASGSYALAYKVPLVTQPATAGAYPVSNGVCTLTTVETITPACAVANTTYGQSGSAAIVSALTLNTSPIDPQITTVSSTTVYTPNAGGRTTVTYVPGSRIALGGMPTAFLPFAISAAEATTVPSVLGTINVAPGLMNFVGRTLEICGKATTTASTATIVSIQFQWDSMGMNTAGKGVQIGNLSITPAAAFSTTKVITFCEDFQTTVAGATATAGSINSVGGFIATSGVSSAAAGQGAGSDASIGAVGSLNLAADARINVISVHTTGTDGAALTLQSLTAKVIN